MRDMLAEIIITAMGHVTWDTSKISSMAKFGLSAGQCVQCHITPKK